MMEKEHALLSASGAFRWMNCTPSARLEEKFDEQKQSIHAAEGTLAHEFGAINLKSGQIPKKVFDTEIKKLRENTLYTDEMEGEVDKYVSYVMQTFTDAQKRTPDAVLLVEEKLDFSHLVEEGFGTGDACIIADGVLDIIDLKYGIGIKVDATDNPQLKLYGAGALRAYELMYDIHTIRMTIVQPRLDHISVWDISVEDLNKWGEKEVKPKAKEAYLGEGLQKTGDWCKWCKVKPVCAAQRDENMKLAQYDFQDPYLLTDKQLIDVFKQQPKLTEWVNAVHQHLLDKALKGKKVEGYKLVEGRRTRKWLEDEKVAKVLIANNFSPEDFMISKLAGIPAIEKLIGKKNFIPILGDLVTLPPGKPTLVPEADKRPGMGIEQAKMDFN